MKTIKIIDLLNMIANGEKVPKVMFDDEIYEFCTTSFANNETGKVIFNFYIDKLNKEVEIIEEEKEIEKCDVLEHCVDFSKNENVLLDNQLRLQDKINELIEAINSINKGK